ncbi:hypothetical protein BGW39_003056 [Mortierella sp. 14UC]|nr:hypothetical protein BGW39_003056 [Mortierella sp. 14UC]
MSRRIEEKHSRILTGLLKLPENKKCFDCPSKVNVYANLFNNTFICEKCSGLLRELNHRVKSISASTFTSEEIAALQKGGNSVAKNIWLATWSWREYPEPDAHEVDNVRQFMRAKYVKKSCQSIDVNNHITSPGTPTAATPERTLSRKSSTLSSDSGSTTFSKSTDPSSAGSSPFHAAGAQKSAQPPPSQYQNLQQQQQQQQRRQGSFDNAMGLTANNYNSNNTGRSVLGAQAFAVTPAAVETSDPFSLMTNAFGNMGMNSSLPAGIDSSDAFGTQSNGGYVGQPAFSQAQAPLSQAPSSNNFFSAFSQPSPSAALQATSSDPFSLAASSQTQHRQHQPFMNQSAFQGLDFGGSVSSLATPVGPTVSGIGAGALGGAKSFDDYLSVLGQGQQQQQTTSSSVRSVYNSPPSAFSAAASSTTSLSPQSTGSANPFGLQQQQQQQQPHQLQRAFTADYISTSIGYNGNTAAPASSEQRSNPFAMFAKQPQPQPQPSFSDPFGNMTAPQQYQQQQQHDYFSNSGLGTAGSSSPNPFAMASGAQPGAHCSPFDQQQQQQAMQSAFIRSAAESSYNFQNAFGNNNNAGMGHTAGPSSSIYESAFSMPGAPSRSMTVPATMNQYGSVTGNNNSSMNDMFGQWMKPSPVAATSKYPSIDDLDPFSATLSSSSSMPASAAGATSTSAYSNPFSLNM